MLRRLEQALAAWSDRSDDGAARPAAELLSASETFFAAAGGAGGAEEKELCHTFLDATSVPAFLSALGEPAPRRRWTEVAFAAIRRSGFSLETLLAQRALALAGGALFEEFGRASPARWSYSRIHERARGFAAAFLAAGGKVPRIALYLDNSVDGACSDLACLLHDILVTPLNTHFGPEEIAWIFDRLGITIAVSDSEERLLRLLEIQRRVRTPFVLFSVQPNRTVERGDARLLGEAVARLAPGSVEGLLAERPRRGLDEISTVMFTSGSTGRPKGVAFTTFNLVSKRFARAAALPNVGDGEILLSYLPLYHTFGRYLEMLGTVFWRGTYVFAGNPSAETLLEGMRQVRPTGLIGVPLRWVQIRDRSLEVMQGARSESERKAAFRSVVGERLRWGLSAAGYLDPRVFRHFQRHGVQLCSGFGMTEATGGITMSPPGDYVANSVGVPLPGIRVRLTDSGEMQIAGPYVARYLAEDGTGLDLVPALQADGEEWLSTGDVFERLERGHLSIVDRIKDIYKNDRGQTIAPNRVERKFHGVPGIRRTFLVGDRRSFNVLLVVPDHEDPMLRDAPDGDSRREYFHQIVASANEDLAPYERVVNYVLLERDFDLERGELTPKGSYRRQAIERNFAGVIDTLYERPWVDLPLAGARARVPRWFFRDLGILETDIQVADHGLFDHRRGLLLPLRREPDEPLTRIGDLDYNIPDGVVDLGLFARQPRLWMANPALMAFAPCREGWDVPLGSVSAIALLPRGACRAARDLTVNPRGVDDAHLLEINRLLQAALYGGTDGALSALRRLAEEMGRGDDRLGATIRRRIAALAHHGEEAVRCLAYRILLLDEPVSDYNEAFPAFVNSGLSFLNEPSIEAIAAARFEQRRLQALRQRLARYRAQMPWPAGETARRQFEQILVLLASFVRHHPEYYKPVRAELASWILHRGDEQLSAAAQEILDGLVGWYEGRLEQSRRPVDDGRARDLIRFDDEIPSADRERLLRLLVGTSFLRQSMILTFDEQDFDLDDVAADGIWLSRIQSRGGFRLYLLNLSTRRRRHFDLLVILLDDMDSAAVMQASYWMVAIGDHPSGERTLPRFGCIRPELGATSLEYVKDLTLAEKIRGFAGADQPRSRPPEANEWRKLFLRAMATIFRAWDQSGRRIVPGSIDPANVAIPENDFHEGAVLLSLAGWQPYRNTLSLFAPLYKTFYSKTRALYAASSRILRHEWIFDACVEALGAERGQRLLRRFQQEASEVGADVFDEELLRTLGDYLTAFPTRYHRPLPLSNAIDRYHEWNRVNPHATPEARAQFLEGVIDLYRLARFGESARYHLYRHTYFAGANERVLETYDKLLEAVSGDPARSAIERVELSDLQSALATAEDREVFSRLIFPQARRPQRLEVVAFGDAERKQVVVRTHFVDAQGEPYDMREPVEPEEIGQLYRLFFQERFPKAVSELDRHLIATDAADRVIGGLCYKLESPEIAHIDGVVVNASVAGRGIATALLEDFANRMAGRGVKVLRTGFIMREFCEHRGFHPDRRWGGLVRFLAGGEEDLAISRMWAD